MKKFLLSFVLAAAALLSGGELKWDSSNNFGKWGRPVRMTMKRQNGVLVINSKSKDPCFHLDNISLKPADYNLLVIEYRVPGKIESGNQGRIYFLRDKDKTFSGVFINLGSYICDGQWHKKEIPLTSANIRPFKFWKDAASIRKLRFDPFDNAGNLEIRSIAFIKDDQRAKTAAASLLSGGELKWDSSNNFGKWGRPVRMTMKRQNGVLVINSKSKDPCFHLDNISLKPADYNLLVIEYRVPGKIESGNQGRIYFLRDKDKTFSGVFINLGSYICDGQWHKKEIPLTSANIRPFKFWKDAASIRKLRFDPFDNAGNLEIRSIAFIKDDQRAKTAAAAQKSVRFTPAELLEKSSDGINFDAFTGNYKLSTETPADGKYCMEQSGNSNSEYEAKTKTVLPVKPDTRYVLRFYSRNTIPVGHVLFRFIQSRKSDELAPSSYLDSGWTQLACNLDKWTLSEKEFRTYKNTYGIGIAFHVKNNGVGKAWWDKIELVEVKETSPALTIQPNSLFSTFTDIKTQEAYQYTIEGKKRKQIAWREITVKDNPLVILCNELVPAGAKISIKLERNGKIFLQESRNAAAKVTLPLPVLELPEGKYLLSVSAIKDGKILCSAEKFIYRHPSVKLEKPAPIETVTGKPGKRGLYVNGKPFLWINLSGFPYTFISPDLTVYPDVEKLILLARKHFGINTLSVIANSGFPHYDRLPRAEFLPQAVKFFTESYSKQLDFCLKNQMYARVSTHMGSGYARKGVPDAELTARVAAAIRRHPALLAYTYDEPEPRRCPPEAIGKLYQAIKAVDKNHPVNINLCVRHTFKDYLKYTDVASYDFYPFPHSDLKYWQVYNQEMLKHKPDAPFATYLQTFQFGTTEFPTHENMYGSFVTSFINGSRSVWYFTYYSNNLQTLTTHPYAQSTVRLISNHAIKLFPFLCEAKEVALKLKADSDILYQYYSNGQEGCLMAVNLSSKNPASMELALPGNGEITDFFDSAWKYKRNSKITLPPCNSIILKVR